MLQFRTCRLEEVRKRKVAVQKRASRGDSIEKRPDDVLFREEFGHWEMDTVVGAQFIKTIRLRLTLL
jgi:IS30 family transposase